MNPEGLLLEASDSTLLGAVAAMQHAIAAAMVAGHAPGTLCAMLRISNESTRVLLGTRTVMAELTRKTGAAASSIEEIRERFPTEVLVMVDVAGSKSYGVGLSRLMEMVATLKARQIN
jgi:hypothetical protein